MDGATVLVDIVVEVAIDVTETTAVLVGTLLLDTELVGLVIEGAYDEMASGVLEL